MPRRPPLAGDPVRAHIHCALDAAREALFGHAMEHPGVIDALRRAQHELASAELLEIERLRRTALRLTVDPPRRAVRGRRA